MENTSQPYSSGETLDKIVKEIPSKSKPSFDTNRQVLFIEEGEEEIYDELPIFTWGRKFRCFEIFPNRTVTNFLGPGIQVSYPGSDKHIALQVRLDIQVDGAYNLIRFLSSGREEPSELLRKGLNDCITGYTFDHQDFILNYATHENTLKELIRNFMLQAGLMANITLKLELTGPEGEDFINMEHEVHATTSDSQSVEIKHTLALTRKDSIRYSLSGVKDIRAWVKSKLDELTHTLVIELTYANVLVNLPQHLFKEKLLAQVSTIGYEVKQIITVPGIEVEQFYFETAPEKEQDGAEYATADPRLKIKLNMVVGGRLHLQNNLTKVHIKPDVDILDLMKQLVKRFTRQYVNDTPPDFCYLEFTEFERKLTAHLETELRKQLGFKSLHLSAHMLETDLIDRFNRLRARLHRVDIRTAYANGDLSLWFRVERVDARGWPTFVANSYATTDLELDAIGLLIKNAFEATMLRNTDALSGKKIRSEFDKAANRIIGVFGLVVELHDLFQGLDGDENNLIRIRQIKQEAKVAQHRVANQGKLDTLKILQKELHERMLSGDMEDPDIAVLQQRIDGILEEGLVSETQLAAHNIGNDLFSSSTSKQVEENTQAPETGSNENEQ